MLSLKLHIFFLSKQRQIKTYGKTTCVLDYLWDQVKGRKGFKTYDYNKLKNELYSYVPEGDEMVSTEEIIKLSDECHQNVAVHAFDSRYRNFIRHTNGHPDIILVFIVRDHHCILITDEKLKIVSAKAN